MLKAILQINTIAMNLVILSFFEGGINPYTLQLILKRVVSLFCFVLKGGGYDFAVSDAKQKNL